MATSFKDFLIVTTKENPKLLPEELKRVAKVKYDAYKAKIEKDKLARKK